MNLEQLKVTQPRNWPMVFTIDCLHCGQILITKMKFPDTWYNFLAAFCNSKTCPTTCPRCGEEVLIKTLRLL